MVPAVDGLASSVEQSPPLHPHLGKGPTHPWNWPCVVSTWPLFSLFYFSSRDGSAASHSGCRGSRNTCTDQCPFLLPSAGRGAGSMAQRAGRGRNGEDGLRGAQPEAASPSQARELGKSYRWAPRVLPALPAPTRVYN